MTKWFNLWKKYRIGIFIFVTVVTAIYIFPIIWTFITSLRPTQDIYRYPPTIIPGAVTLQNYIYVLTQMKGFLRYFLNSVVVTFITAVIVIISSAMGGYAFGMRKFRGQNMLFAAVIAVLMIPYLMYLIPIFIMEDKEFRIRGE